MNTQIILIKVETDTLINIHILTKVRNPMDANNS